jgi:hypothetical protein
MEYTVDYFIEKFEAIPESMWANGIGGYFSDANSPKCALGHLNNNNDKSMSYHGMCKEARSLCNLFSKAVVEIDFNSDCVPGSERLVWGVNDGYGRGYKQPTPKQRILAALYDIKAQQNIVDAAKEIIQNDYSILK